MTKKKIMNDRAPLGVYRAGAPTERRPYKRRDATRKTVGASSRGRPGLLAFSRMTQVLALLLTLACSHAFAQQNNSAKRQKLPSPEKIVNDYLKAIGGKKRVAAIKDATYEWTIGKEDPPFAGPGTYRMQLKSPDATHTVIAFKVEHSDGALTDRSYGNEPSEVETGANARSAWVRDAVSGLRTLTDAEAQIAKLYSMLIASHFVDYKKSRILARTVRLDESAGEPAYIVEFSLRNGARVRFWFCISSKLLLATEDKPQKAPSLGTFADYKDENGILEPHKINVYYKGVVIFTMSLQRVRYNTGLSDSLFDPPSSDPIDVGAILKEVDLNQDVIDERVGEYTYTEKLTERKINDKGEVTEEKVTLYEVYPVPGGNDVRKLISENGVVLSPDKAEKEEKRVTEEMEKAQRERTRTEEKRKRDKQKGKTEKSDDDDLGVADFLRAAELVSPRREKLRDRDAIVVDFRPRAGYKPKNSLESIVSKLAGVMWIDPVDKQVMRLEARLIESYKMGGGLLASVRPGTALVFEQKRMDDGVWLPVFTQANISAKILLFKGVNLNVVQEFSNYQRFKSNVEDYKLASPDEKSKAPPSP